MSKLLQVTFWKRQPNPTDRPARVRTVVKCYLVDMDGITQEQAIDCAKIHLQSHDPNTRSWKDLADDVTASVVDE